MEIQISGDWFPLFCAKDASISIAQEALEVTSINSARWREYIPGMANATLDCNGITTLDNSNGRVSIFYLIQPAVMGQILTMRMRFEDEDGNPIGLLFSAFLTSANISRSIGSFSQSSVTMQISGSVTPTTDIAPPVEPVCEVQSPLYLMMDEGDTSVQSDSIKASNVEILNVGKDGSDGWSPTTGTPGNMEYAYNSGTGTISFDPTNPAPPGGQPIYILYKTTS